MGLKISDIEMADGLLPTKINGVTTSGGSVPTREDACTMTEVDLETDADVVVTAAPAVLLGLYVNTVFSAHAVSVIDNVTAKIVLPASMAAGTKIDCHSATFATNISINSDNAATGDLVVFWRAI